MNLFKALILFLLIFWAEDIYGQRCLELEFLEFSSCESINQGGVATFTVVVTPADSSAQSGRWILTNGTGGGRFGEPVEITMEYGSIDLNMNFGIGHVEDPDCWEFFSYTLPCPRNCSFDFDVEAVSGSSCTGIPTGSVTFETEDLMAPFSIELTGPNSTTMFQENELTFENLPEGYYSATVSVDGELCKETIDFYLPFESGFRTEVFTAGLGTDREVIASIYGGTEPYSLLWNTGETTQIIPYELGEAYDVTVTDAEGCVAYNYLYREDCLDIEAEITNASCGQNNAAIDITIPFDSFGLLYYWNNGDNTEDLDGIPP